MPFVNYVRFEYGGKYLGFVDGALVLADLKLDDPRALFMVFDMGKSTFALRPASSADWVSLTIDQIEGWDIGYHFKSTMSSDFDTTFGDYTSFLFPAPSNSSGTMGLQFRSYFLTFGLFVDGAGALAAAYPKQATPTQFRYTVTRPITPVASGATFGGKVAFSSDPDLSAFPLRVVTMDDCHAFPFASIGTDTKVTFIAYGDPTKGAFHLATDEGAPMDLIPSPSWTDILGAAATWATIQPENIQNNPTFYKCNNLGNLAWIGTLQLYSSLFVDPTGANCRKLSLTVKVPGLGEIQSSGQAAGYDLSYVDLTGAQLANANLAGANLRYANLTGANLAGAKLPGADLTGANLAGATLTNANLSRAKLDGASFTGATMKMGGTDFSGADLTTAVFGLTPTFSTDPNNPTKFVNATLNYAAIGLNWSCLDLTGATIHALPQDLSKLQVTNTKASGIDLSGANSPTPRSATPTSAAPTSAAPISPTRRWRTGPCCTGWSCSAPPSSGPTSKGPNSGARTRASLPTSPTPTSSALPWTRPTSSASTSRSPR